MGRKLVGTIEARLQNSKHKIREPRKLRRYWKQASVDDLGGPERALKQATLVVKRVWE